MFSERHRFSDWPNSAIPAIAAGVYLIWDHDTFIYAGMSGREIEKAPSAKSAKYGLTLRLGMHASGRLSGNQFAVYVANRLVIPSLEREQLELFRMGTLTLDMLTKAYIRDRFEYQFACVPTSKEARALELRCRNGTECGAKPLLNPC